MADPAERGDPRAVNPIADRHIADRRPEGIPLPATRDDRSSDLTCVKDDFAFPSQDQSMWQPISNAPFDRDLELAVIDGDGAHALVFPCRRVLTGWTKAATKERVDVSPTHWRTWEPATKDV
ncbi:hypothetical protein [Mesorhizobium sp. Mes31]|jgi:hypothetical protein|uniref:hypothetical protein n=1 Tax=Mesorhizobium sp. Mes31 TaxID=2926017 RepID=UPI002118EA11|nr:hypothetical protein [Mesorhizobium sp. Mes31]